MGAYGDHRKALVRALKAKIVAAGGVGVMVRGGRGTAWGWIDVWGPNFGDFTPAQRKAVEQVTGSPAGANCWVGTIEDVERIVNIRR